MHYKAILTSLLTVIGIAFFALPSFAFNYGIGYSTGDLDGQNGWELSDSNYPSVINDILCEGGASDLCLKYPTNNTFGTNAQKNYATSSASVWTFSFYFPFATTSITNNFLRVANTNGISFFEVYNNYNLGDPYISINMCGQWNYWYDMIWTDWIWGRFIWDDGTCAYQLYNIGSSENGSFDAYDATAYYQGLDPPEKWILSHPATTPNYTMYYDRLHVTTTAQIITPEFISDEDVQAQIDNYLTQLNIDNQNISNLIRNASTRFPFVYLFGTQAILNELTTTTSAPVITLNTPTSTAGVPNISLTLFDSSYFDKYVNLNLFRTIISYLLWLMLLFYYFKRAKKAF